MVLMTMTVMMIMLIRIPMMMVAIAMMMMMIVKVDGKCDGGDGSGCDLEGVAWRIASSSMTISRARSDIL